MLAALALVSGSALFAGELKNQRGADTPRSPKKTPPKFELKDGDRVVFLGNTLIERAQKYGYWETMLTARYPDRKIIFRNLGWDGDTVWAESRGLFDPPAKGYERMLARIAGIKPTVIFLGYGNNEAFAGKKGLPRFIKQYNKLLDDLTKVSAKGVRFVLLSPTRHDRVSEVVPDPREYNKSARLYSDALKSIAEKRGAAFVNFIRFMDLALFQGPNFKRANFHTSNGVHLDRSGYKGFSRVLELEFFKGEEPAFYDGEDDNVSTSKSKQGRVVSIQSDAARVTKTTDTESGLTFICTYHNLGHWIGAYVRVKGLPAGTYRCRVVGQKIRDPQEPTRTAVWEKGLQLLFYNEEEQFEKLRQAIIAKNRLYFYSWRPQNITYLFLFRKHEQGQNAKEVKEFERLVAAKEKEIDRLKKPVTRTYELIRVKGKK